MCKYHSEEEFLKDFRICKKCKKNSHVLEMKIFLTGEVSRYCKGCYCFNPRHTYKVFHRNKYQKKYKFLKFKDLNYIKAIQNSKNFDTFVKN